MTGSQGALRRLEDWSEWFSPLVVKEVRQIVRGREFYYSFGASLVAGLAVAFFGAGDALSGSTNTGTWTFVTLMGCLSFVGLAVVPLSAFSALRNERAEQTLDLITLTALSPRRVLVGKLLAQAVKLATLFAAMAPFVATCFLLGGIDLLTILVSLVILFLWSMWACAFCLFLSTLFKSRAMSGLIFGGAAILVLMVLGISRPLFFAMRVGGVGGGPSGTEIWWVLAIAVTACVVTMVNLILLGENRLSLPSEDRTTALRVGFLLQFLTIAGWTLSFINSAPHIKPDAIEGFGTVAGLHLAVVAMFALTEDLVVSRRVWLRLTADSGWRWLLSILRPGGGRGAAYVLVQMVLLLGVAGLFGTDGERFRWLLAICGYICFFCAVPVFVFRFLRPASQTTLKLRVAILVLIAISMIMPDVVHYVLWQPDVLSLDYSARHLVSPFATLANWDVVERERWFAVPLAMGLIGLVSSLGLIAIGRRMTAESDVIDVKTSASAGEPGRADLY